MIDPGNPFLAGHDFGSLVSALEDSIHLGVEQEAIHRTTFNPALLVYPLPVEVTGVERVTGLANGKFLEFVEGLDYRQTLSRVVWQLADAVPGSDAPRHPDPNSAFEVTYRFRDVASGITDYGPGSVSGTLLRAVARELALLYHETNEAYRRAFLDTASGRALDAVVALLGVVRNPAQPASGSVVFTRKRAGSRMFVGSDTVLEEAGGRRYVTTAEATFESDATAAEVTIRAEEPGPLGNIGAGAVTVMPTPVPGVDEVSNPEAITGGQDDEPDDRLRERARHALERAGNATLSALEFGVRDVDGVDDVVVIDHSIDPNLGLGEVWVRFAVGGSSDRQAAIADAVGTVIETTRAAGVNVVAELASDVTISGDLVVFPAEDVGAGLGSATTGFARAVADQIDQLGVGQPLSLRKLVAMVYQAPGVAEVAEAQLDFERADRVPPGFPADGAVGELLALAPSERCRAGQLNARPITTVDAADSGVARLRLRLFDAGQQPVTFRDASIQVRVEVRAQLIHQPSAPAVPIADVVKSVNLLATDTAEVALTTDDLVGFDDTAHQPLTTVRASLAGYPGVAAGTAQVRVR